MPDRRENPYTQRAIERAIKAAMAAGLTVTGVLPNGTVLTEKREHRAPVTLTGRPKPRDAREKFGARR